LPIKNRVVMDSYALIGYLEDEPFAARIQKILQEARKGKTHLFLNALQLGEVYYITLREQGQSTADLVYARIKAFPLQIIDTLSEELLLTAASLKAAYPISYADSFAAATAMLFRCPLLTGDPDFKALEADNLLAVEWLAG